MNKFESNRQTLNLKKRQIVSRYKLNEKIKFNLLKRTVFKRFDSKKTITNLNDKVSVKHTKIGKKLSIKNGEIK